MDVHFTPEAEAKLAQVAAENHTAAAGYVAQLVEHYLDHDRWFRAQVQEGLDADTVAAHGRCRARP